MVPIRMMMFSLVFLLLQITCSFSSSIPDEEIDPLQVLAPADTDLYNRRLALLRNWIEQGGLNVQPYGQEVRMFFFNFDKFTMIIKQFILLVQAFAWPLLTLTSFHSLLFNQFGDTREADFLLALIF